MSWLSIAMDVSAIEDSIEECDGKDEVEKVLRDAGLEWNEKKFSNGETFLIVEMGGRKAMIDPDFPRVVDAEEWVSSLYSWKLSQYVEPIDFNAEFWGGNAFVPELYHGMRAFDTEPVLRDGLLPHNETRGISNRGTGSAVFATEDEDVAASHGSVVFAINTAAMRSDGYTPLVARENPIEEEEMRDRLAWSLDLVNSGWENTRLDELSSDGIFGTTVIIFGAVPPKYLRIVRRNE